jgi:hypothetical protein
MRGEGSLGSVCLIRDATYDSTQPIEIVRGIRQERVADDRDVVLAVLEVRGEDDPVGDPGHLLDECASLIKARSMAYR